MRIQSRKVWIADQFIPVGLEIDQGKIQDVLPYREDLSQVDADYADLRIVPGFIDIHCHGAYGYDTMDGEEEGLLRWCRRIPSEGVTAFLPTTVTGNENGLEKALENVADVMEKKPSGAQILGLHLEGPFINPARRGVHPKAFIREPDVDEFCRLQEAARGQIRVLTMAPELDKNFALTRYGADHGVVVSIGHSNASYDEVLMAIAHGAKSMTHVYNGMKPYHHRDNGPVGAALRIASLYGEAICDGLHSTPAALHTFFQAKDPDRAVMVSDALRGKGMPAGSVFQFGGQETRILPDGTARLTGEGTLAGSTLHINEGLRLLVEEAMVPFPVALNACTRNPAALLGLSAIKGSIAAGMDADLVVLEDDYQVHAAYARGSSLMEF